MMQYTRPSRTQPTRTWYVLCGLVTIILLMAMWISSLFMERELQPTRRAAVLREEDTMPSISTQFIPNREHQELADRILALNGLIKATELKSVSVAAPQTPTPFPSQSHEKSIPAVRPKPVLLVEDLTCPLIEITGTDLQIPIGNEDGNGKKYFPVIPQLYEPRAPSALYLPPIPISVDPQHPSLFNIDPTTGKSTTKIVYSLLGATVNTAAVATTEGKPVNLQATASDFSPRTLLHPDFISHLPPPTCAQQSAKIVDYWRGWSKQQATERPLNVLVWHGTWRDTTTNAKQGGPMGELGLFTSTMLALTAMSAKVTFFTWPEGEKGMLDAMGHFEEYDIILIDTYSSGLLADHKYLDNSDVLCRIRALDYWGTPAHQNSWKVPSLKQYLVPFACTREQTTPNYLLLMHRFKNLKTSENQFEDFTLTPAMAQRDATDREREEARDSQRLTWTEAKKTWPMTTATSSTTAGSSSTSSASDDPLEPSAKLRADGTESDLIRSDASQSTNSAPSDLLNLSPLWKQHQVNFPKVYAKKFQILVWGKEAKYFQGLSSVLRAIAEVVPMVTIVKKDGEMHFPDVSDLPRTSEGHLRIRHLGVLNQEEMAKVQSESALLLGVGDPIFSFTPLESLLVGTPYLNPNFYPPKSYWMNTECVITSQHPYAERLGAPQTWNYNIGNLDETKFVIRTALKWIRETQEQLGGIPSLYPKELTYPNLVRRLNDNFRTDMCQENGRQPTPAHKA